jgi:hypothetical protein
MKFLFTSTLAVGLLLSFDANASTLDGLRVNPVKYPRSVKISFDKHLYDLKTEAGLVSVKKAFEKKQSSFDPKTQKKEIKLYAELIELVELALDKAGNSKDRADAVVHILEIVDTFRNFDRSPVPRKVDVPFTLPALLFDYLNNPMGEGTTVATNLNYTQEKPKDLSLVDPLPSTFWQRPKSITNADVFFGFNRRTKPQIENSICTYDSPKTSLGAHPGFTVLCGKDEIKVKFGEENTEPFAVRIFHILGFNAEPVDFAEQVQIQYSRKLLQDFNGRTSPSTKITIAGIPVGKRPLFGFFNPFDYVTKVVLRNGTEISASVAQKTLLLQNSSDKPNFSDKNINEEFENQISIFVFAASNIQEKEKNVKSIGAWDWNRIGHAERRELRGAALLSGWLNWYDSRWDNTRLKFLETPNGLELRHYISDLGSVLGRAKDFLTSKSGDVDAFPWGFTELIETWERVYPNREVPLIKVYRFTFKKFHLAYDDNNAFREMTMDDARWMGRMIAQITEKQITEALVASGFSSAQVRLYVEKLVARRDRMIKDVRLDNEIAPLRPQGIDKKINYDPSRDGLIRVEINGTLITAPDRGDKIIKGEFVSPNSSAQSRQLNP